MRNFSSVKVILLTIVLCMAVCHAGAKDIYISNKGKSTIDASTLGNPAPLSDLKDYVSSYPATSDRTLTIYFIPDTYYPSTHLTFPTAANANGLVVTIAPATAGGSVIFDGSCTNVRFLATTEMSAYTTMTVNLKNITIRNYMISSGESESGGTSLIRVGAYSTVNLDHVTITGVASARNPLMSIGGSAKFNVKNSTISNIVKSSYTLPEYPIFDTSATYSTLSIENSVLDNWTVQANSSSTYSNMFRFETESSTFILKNSTIKNCSTNNDLIVSTYASFNGTISGNSFINNTRKRTAEYCLINASTGAYTIYNNTFSGNTYTYCMNVNANEKVFNNTIYNSGLVNLSGAAYFVNNIVCRYPIPDANTYSGVTDNCYRNIQTYQGKLFYNIAGNSGGVDVTSDFDKQFSRTLTTHTEPGSQVHSILDINGQDHAILSKGGTAENLKSLVGTTLTHDQLGHTRPSGKASLSIGAIDTLHYELSAKTIQINLSYSSVEKTLPPDTTINLADNIVGYPLNTNASGSTFSIVNNGSTTGIFSLNDSKLTFKSPALDTIASEYICTYKVSNGSGHEAVGYVLISLKDHSYPPGYVDPKDYPNTCFDFMGTVTFTSAFKFKGHEVNGTSRTSSGFSIPLVADLNGDKYPEIVTFGKNASVQGDAYYQYQYIYIYNGQTGKELARLTFANAEFYISGAAWHPSPAPGALVDVDRDGKIELLMTFPATLGDEQLRSRLASYTIVPTGNTYNLKRNWISSQTYSSGISGTVNIPTPQVCDLDGDGTPEVLVYNKVYNAQTGEVLFTIDASNMGRDNYGYYYGDRQQAFPYIYDMDKDGIYDIAAGKVLYQITKPNNTFKINKITLTVPSGYTDPLDGYTGVADIDGDGSPDIVTVRSADVGAASDILVTVWNPGFSNKTSPFIVAQKRVSTIDRAAATGSHSYVYIGDIDGREQLGKRLPEIAVMTGHISVKSSEKHPNVSGILTSNGGIPTGNITEEDGAIFALTYDTAGKDLKYSFVMGHSDSSIDTGFTMFDFDNDGVQEICYRDEESIRIIKPTIPYVKHSYTTTSHPKVILFFERAYSYTGFEYPVIADIDNDASADMVYIGHNNSSALYTGFPFAVGNGSGDKFAPSRSIWNQFMYDPFKINDDLTTPIGKAADRLRYVYTHEVKFADGSTKTIENYQPFNCTLGQVPYFMTIENTPNDYFEPIIFLTEAYIVSETSSEESKRPKITTNGSSSHITITIGNRPTAKTDISLTTPITLYKTTVSSGTYVKTVRLRDLGVGSTIGAGKEMQVQIPIDDPYALYYVRLGDDSGNAKGTAWEAWRFGINDGTDVDNDLGIGKSSRAYRDCNWDDQTVKVSLVGLNADAVTVQEHGTVLIDILANDNVNIQDEKNPFPTQVAGFQMEKKYILGNGPVAGELTFSGNKVIYTHNKEMIPPNNIDTFSYAFTYTLSGSTKVNLFSARVYIYILQPESGGFGACYGEDYETKLKENPKGVRFLWNKDLNAPDDESKYTGGADSLTIHFGEVKAPVTYLVKPILKSSWTCGERVEFVPGELTISVLGENKGDHAVMKWTGNVSTNWHNPNNWVEVKKGVEQPVTYIPTGCVDVIIPSGLARYPELSADGSCARITMKDRAMIAGIGHLTYEKAEVELKLKSTERDRFVMWSAPLMDMYSGDYHFKKNGSTNPQWGDVYMSFFQSANPDNNNSAAAGNYFTATFKNLGTRLSLGQAFNLKVVNTTMNKDSVFTFPRSETLYTAEDKTPYPGLTRGKSGRFISDSVMINRNTIPVPGDMAGHSYVQVSNPFMAYLNIREFLNNNPNLESAVKVWSGEAKDNSNNPVGDLVTIKPDLTNGQRYIIDDVELATEGEKEGLIAPLQSFFVQKQDRAAISSLKMNPDWTTTVMPSAKGDYELRAASAETNTLRIKATQNGLSGATVLFYHPESSPDYRRTEDSYKLFYSDAPVSVYSFSPSREPLAVNSSSNFQGVVTPLGLRVRSAGQVTLDFSGMPTFGYNVYLIDHALGNKEIDIQASPSYTFTVTKASSDKAVELNDRFSLRATFTGNGVGNEHLETANGLQVYSHDGYIHVQAVSPITGVQVYNVAGALVYSSNIRQNQFRIPVDNQKAYLVKVRIDDEYRVEKVFVK